MTDICQTFEGGLHFLLFLLSVLLLEVSILCFCVLESEDPREDVGHLYSFVDQLKHLKVFCRILLIYF